MRVPKWLKKVLGDRSYWLNPYEEWGLRRGFAETLRWWADRIADEDAFTKHGGLKFANKNGVGQVLWFDHRYGEIAPAIRGDWPKDRGVELWYRVSDYKTRGWED